MTPDAGWLVVALPVLVFAVPMLLGAFLMEVVWPHIRGQR